MNFSFRNVLTLTAVTFLSGCANIIAPQGGQKDVTPPKLISISPKDSLLNTRVTKIEMRFDEFITVNNPSSEIVVSPILPFPLSAEVSKRSVIVKIPDSLLQENTTYRLSFGKAIQDVHENNPYTGNYVFSTGSYFDSLRLRGHVINAATGLRDTGALLLLYDGGKSDSVVVREKPLYVTRADGNGDFSFDGLPGNSFRIYALKDANSNMIFDGTGEMIAFSDSVVFPKDSVSNIIRLNIFKEIDTLSKEPETEKKERSLTRARTSETATADFSYSVNVDTSDSRKRTKEFTKPIEITFTKPVQEFNINRINLSFDSANISVETPVEKIMDTTKPDVVVLKTNWKENTVYTLRLLKGFAKDTAGSDAMPGRYTFRTKRDEDYAKLHIHLPSKYAGDNYIFVLLKDNDTVHHRAVTDTMVHFYKLQPGNYSMRVIVDENKNGRWDTGSLLEKIQPEEVIPYLSPISLKPGWENMIDFEERKRRKTDFQP